QEVSWLFKTPKTGHFHDGRTYRRHDDVAEAVVCEVAKLLSIPTAQVRLAQRDDTPGVISRNVIRPDHNLRSGDMVLLGIEGYESCAGDRRSNARPGHNLKNIASVMTGLLGPAGTDYADWAAFDVFSGCLLLDALTGGFTLPDRPPRRGRGPRRAGTSAGVRPAGPRPDRFRRGRG